MSAAVGVKPKGTALGFACEGDTEVVFFQVYLGWVASLRGDRFWPERDDEESVDDSNKRWWYAKGRDARASEVEIAQPVYFRSMGSIYSMPQAATLTDTMSRELGHGFPIRMFLCHDTDGVDISRFYEADWNSLRERLANRDVHADDLMADGDIECEMMRDMGGVLRFLNLPREVMEGDRLVRKYRGKKRMRRLFRIAGKVYHEGYRARPLIESLSMEAIEAATAMPLNLLKEALI